MVQSMVLVEREVLQHELETVFDAPTTATLLRVLDRVASQVYAAVGPRVDYARIEEILERTAERLEQNSIQIQELLEAQKRHEARFARIESDIVELKGDVKVLKGDVTVLKGDVKVLKDDVTVLKDDVGHLKGDSLERKYREKAPAYFGRLVRKPKVVDVNRLWEALESHLSEEELADVLLLDLVVQGAPKDRSLSGDLYLALEVSTVVDRNDVERALRRADLLRKAGFTAIPVVAGESLTSGAEQEARTRRVAIVQNGGVMLWDEAFAACEKNVS